MMIYFVANFDFNYLITMLDFTFPDTIYENDKV